MAAKEKTKKELIDLTVVTSTHKECLDNSDAIG